MHALARVLRGLLLLVLALLALAMWFPASWAWALVRDRYPAVQVQEVSGTVWDGRGRSLVVAGEPLQTLDWRIGRSALWGRLRMHVHASGVRLEVQGSLRRGDGSFSGDGLRARLPAAILPVAQRRPSLEAVGTFDITIDHWRVQRAWPVMLQGTVAWNDAGLRDGSRTAALGRLKATLSSMAGTAIGVQLVDDGKGPVQLRGEASITPLGWRLDATLHPRQRDPSLQSMLAAVGVPDGHGGFRVYRQAGLMMREQP